MRKLAFALPLILSTAVLAHEVGTHTEGEARKRRGTERQQMLYARGLGEARGESFSFHKLNYAVVGDMDLKLQYSFKYRFVQDVNFFASFTNFMLWEIFEESIPMTDNNFNPELFYRFVPDRSWLLSSDVGYWHLSNGQDDVESRGWDRLYARFNHIYEWKRIDMYSVTHIFFATLSKSRNNPDIHNYLGWWSVSFWIRNLFNYSSGESLDLELKLVSGDHGDPFDKGSTTVGLQYRVRAIPRFNPTLYLQYFNGYGEVILNYNKRAEELRGGFSWYY